MKNQFLLYTIGASAYALINLTLVPLYVKELATDQYGLLSLFFVTVNLIITITGLGIQNSIIRYYYETEDRSDVIKAKNSVFVYTVIIAILLITLFLSVSFISTLYAEYLNLAIALIIIVPSRIGIQVSLGLLRVQERLGRYLLLTLGEIIIVLIGIFIIFLNNEITIEKVAYIYSLAALFVFICSYIGSKFSLEFDWKFFSFVIKFGLPLALANLVSYLINYGNRYILAYIDSNESVAYFDVAQKFTSILSLLIVSGFTLSFTPYYLKLYQEVDLQSFRKRINQLITAFVYIYLILGFFLISLDSYLIKFLEKDEYLVSLSISNYLLLSQLFYVLFMLYTLSLNISKKTIYEFYITTITLILGFIISFILIKYYSLTGAAISHMLNSITSLILILMYNHLKFKLNTSTLKHATMVLIFFGYSLIEPTLPVWIKLMVCLICLPKLFVEIKTLATIR